MQKANNTKTNSSIYMRLLGYTFEHKLIFIISIIAMAMFAVTDTAFAALIKPLLDGSFVAKDPDTIRLFPFVLIGPFFVKEYCWICFNIWYCLGR